MQILFDNAGKAIGTEKTPEMDRLLKKMADNNPYKYKEETYSEEDEEGMAN